MRICLLGLDGDREINYAYNDDSMDLRQYIILLISTLLT